MSSHWVGCEDRARAHDRQGFAWLITTHRRVALLLRLTRRVHRVIHAHPNQPGDEGFASVVAPEGTGSMIDRECMEVAGPKQGRWSMNGCLVFFCPQLCLGLGLQ